MHAEYERGQRRDDEDGHGDADDGQGHHQVIGAPVVAQCGERAERDAGKHRRQHRQDTQLQAHRESRGDEFRDREVLELVGGAEVAPGQPGDVAAKLDMGRLVQPVGPLEVGADLRRDRLFLVERPARGEAHEQEGKHHDDRQRRDGAQQALQYVGKHPMSAPLHPEWTRPESRKPQKRVSNPLPTPRGACTKKAASVEAAFAMHSRAVGVMRMLPSNSALSCGSGRSGSLT